MLTPLIASALGLATASGCTGLLWIDALKPVADTPGVEGVIPSDSPDEPDRLFVRYWNDNHHIVGGDDDLYAIAPLGSEPDGAVTTIASQKLQRISTGAFKRARRDPRWNELQSRFYYANRAPSPQRGDAFQTLSVRRESRRDYVHDAVPPSSDVSQPDSRPASDRWEGRLVRLPKSMPRPASDRVGSTFLAVLLTPATLAADVVVIPVLLVYAATSGEHGC
jgi:hypothetical protein